jgi:hypothetical protein
MLVAGRAFDGSTSLDAHERLTPLSGYTSWFTKFRSVTSYYLRHIYRTSLDNIFKHHICCHISGSYATFLAGVADTFQGVYVYSPSGCPAFKFDF